MEIFSHIEDEQTEQEIDSMLAKYNSASDITKNENRSSKPELTEIQKKILNDELSECCKL